MTRATNGEAPDRLSILHLLAGSDAGGLSRYVFDLCSALHAQGHRVAVAAGLQLLHLHPARRAFGT